ncbi:MAG: SUMF1/EgtB/PvdO family nonheme iron enzyme [Polyangiaceae bacterium]|nr:SUMF1/EgtB/PvdO family nonheme iron enzyme [Polyangiaceae bacterium]
MAQRQANIGDVVGGRYQLEEVIGEGGMAVVYRARNTGTKRPCAVKLVRPRLLERPELIEMFVRECQVGHRIGDSPYVVDVRDAGVDEATGVPFMVMELLKGDTLDRVIEAGPSSQETVRLLLEQLSEALDQAHRAGVVHRDLKPSNLFLTHDRNGSLLKILDFGIAKVRESDSARKTSTHVGTPAYAAPEQLGRLFRTKAAKQGLEVASEVSPQTDVWAMGLVAYDLLTGHPSGQFWGAESSFDFPDLVLEGPQPASERAGERATALPDGFDRWLARCLEREAARRWPSAGAAAAAFSRLGAARPVADDEPTAMFRSPLVATPRPARAATSLGVQTMGTHVGSPTPPTAPTASGSTPLPQTQLAAARTMLPELPEAPEAPAPDGASPPTPLWQRRNVLIGGGLVALAAVALAVGTLGSSRPEGHQAVESALPTSSVPTPPATPSASAAAPDDAVTGKMVRVPAGVLLLGGSGDAPDESPPSERPMPAFWLDATEVTVRAWSHCVQAGACKSADRGVQLEDPPPGDWAAHCTGSPGAPLYLGPQHPVNCVDADESAAFCKWASKRLPTEEEWEYAARGVTTVEGARPHKYPWPPGTAPSARLLNACDDSCVALGKAQKLDLPGPMFPGSDGFSATAPVGSFAANAFGLYDMAGNVSEWTASSYSPSYGAATTTKRVSRGANWSSSQASSARVSKRFKDPPATRDAVLGFRCAR